ncbi:MAG: alpha/beta fold hydrolase [Arenimonas sp.]
MEPCAHTEIAINKLRHQWMADDGVALIGEEVQAGKDPCVLFAHGFGQTRQSWTGAQSALAAEAVGSIAWDMRGHGESARNPDALHYQAEQFAEDVHLLSRQFKQKPMLVGASMGGLTGMMVQARHDVFSALILVDVTPRWETAGVARIMAFMNAFPDGFDSYEHAADIIANYLPHRRERKSSKQLQFLLREQDGRLMWHWDRRMLKEFVEHSEHLQDDIREAARQIKVPMLLISGGKSDIVSEHTVADFLQLVPHALHHHLPDATHMVAGDDNDAFNDTLLNFKRTLSQQPYAVTGVSP